MTARNDLEHLAAVAAARLVGTPPAEGCGPPPGVVVGYAVGAQRAVAADGVADPAADIPMRADLRFDLASVSKVLGTTVALATLVAQGALTFDTPVQALVPSFPGHAGTTLRHLLQHRGGLPAWQPLYLAPRAADDPLAVLDSVPPDGPLDSARRYSDLGFLHLGRAVAAAAGAPLDQAVHELALVPLGIPAAAYRPAAHRGTGTTLPRCAPSSEGDRAERMMVATGVPYPVRWTDEGFAWRTHLLRGEANDGNCWHAFGGISGHAGLFATVDELLTAALALSLSVVGEGPVPAPIARELVTPGPDPEQGLGLRLHGSWAAHPGYTGCEIGFVPGQPVAVAVASNRLVRKGPPAPTHALWLDAVDTLPLPTFRQGEP